MNFFTKQEQMYRCQKLNLQTMKKTFPKEEMGWGDQELGMTPHTLLYIRQITNKDLLYSTGNSTQYSVITHMRKEPEKEWIYVHAWQGLPGGTVGNNPPARAGDSGDVGLIPESGRSPGGGNGNPLQYSCLENFMKRGAWWATVHRVEKRPNWELLCICITESLCCTPETNTTLQISYKWESLSRVWLFVTPPPILSMGFSRPEYWSG